MENDILAIDAYIPINHNKLSYRRGTARRAMLVNSCYVSQVMGVIKVSNSKNDLQDHSRALATVPAHWIGHIQFPISLPLQPCLYLALFPRYYHLFHFPKFKRSRDSELIPFEGNISCMHSTRLYQSVHEI